MTIDTLVVGQMAANCYIADGVIIDPGDDAEYILSHAVSPSMIVATHGHFDHIMAAFAIQLAFNIPFVIHEADTFLVKNMQSSAMHFLNITSDPPPKITNYLNDSDKIGNFTVMHTPGHTPGSICLYSKKDGLLFTGDTIFAGGSVGRTDHRYSNPLALSQSIQKILMLPPETKILSGHGDETTVQHELRFHNY